MPAIDAPYGDGAAVAVAGPFVGSGGLRDRYQPDFVLLVVDRRRRLAADAESGRFARNRPPFCAAHVWPADSSGSIGPPSAAFVLFFFPTKSGAFNSPTKLAHPSKWLDCHSQKSSSNPSQAVEWRFFCGQHRVCWGKFHSRTKNRKRNSDCVEMNSGDASFPEDHKRKKKETHRRTSTFFLHQYHVAGSYCRPQKYSNYIHIDSCGGWEPRRDVSNGHKFTNENKESKEWTRY